MRISLVILIGLITYLIYSSEFSHTEPLAPSKLGQTFFNYEQGQLQLSYQIADASPQTLASTWLKLPDNLLDLYQEIEKTSYAQAGTVISSQIDLPFPQNWLNNIDPIFPLMIKAYFDAAGQSYTDFYINPQSLSWQSLDQDNNNLYFQGINGRLQQMLPTHQLQANLPELRLEQKQGFNLKLIDWQLKLDLDGDEKHLNLNLPFSQYTNKGLSFLLESLQIHYQAGKQAARFMFTPAKLSAQLKQAQFTQAENHHHFTNVGFGMVISQDENTMNYHAALNMDKIQSPLLAALDLDDASAAWAFQLKNVDIDALEIIRQVLSDWRQQSLSANVQALLDMINHQAKRLAKRGLAFEISPLSIKTKHGNMQLQLAFEIDKNKPFSLKNIKKMRHALLADINLKIHQNLLRHFLHLYQEKVSTTVDNANLESSSNTNKIEVTLADEKQKIEQQIKKFLTQKLLTKEEEHYHLKAQINNGQLFINGREQPFPLLQ